MATTGAKNAMVDAAEALMAERGIGGVSIREVVAAAGQRNNSAAKYHFGTREGLVEAIVESRMGPINQRRLELLGELDGAGCGEDLTGLVECLVRPLAEATLGRPGSNYARFLAQSYADPQWAAAVDRSLHAGGYRRWRDRVMGCLHDVPEPVRRGRIDHVVALVIMALGKWEAGRGMSHASRDARLADLVDVAVAVLAAPVSDATRAAVARSNRSRSSTAREASQ